MDVALPPAAMTRQQSQAFRRRGGATLRTLCLRRTLGEETKLGPGCQAFGVGFGKSIHPGTDERAYSWDMGGPFGDWLLR